MVASRQGGVGLLNRVFVFFGGLLVLALVAALVLPGFIEWGNYRTDFEKQASRILGQKVEVLGKAKVRILPLPRITFTDVRVGARPDGEPMMVVDRFRVDAELAPLLKGEIVIVNMELQRPRVNISIGKDGVVDWTDRQSGGINPEDVLLEKVTISDGSIRLYSVETDQSFEAEQINVDISARTLAGPWRINGALVLNGEMAEIKVTTGRLQPEGIISARLNIQPQNHPYAIELAGPIGMVKGSLNYKGNFKLRAVKAKKDAEGVESTFPYKALPVRVSGRFDARPDTLKIPEFTLAIGNKDDPYNISGTAQAAFGDRSLFKVVAEGQQIDLDRLARAGSSKSAKSSLSERLNALRRIAEQVPVPAAEGLISLYLPAVVAGDTVIRELGVDILLKKDGWQLSNFDAGLPGRTRLQAQGLLSLGDNFGFKGQILLASKQPSGFAGWLKGDVDEAIRRLPNAGFSAKVALSEKRILLQKLEVVLGATRLNGAFERVTSANARPRLSAILDGNNIDFETLRALFLLFVPDEDGSQLNDHDMDIKLLGENFSAYGLTAGSVVAALKLSDNNLLIEQLELSDLAGADISASGQVRDALNLPDGEVKLLVTAQKSAGLLKLLSNRLGQNPLLANLLENPALVDQLNVEVTIKAVAGSDTSNLQLALVGKAGGTGIDLELSTVGRLDKPGLAETTVDLVLANPAPQKLLRQLALPVLPLDVDGELRIGIKLLGIPDKNVDAEFEVSLGSTSFSGKGDIDTIDGGARRGRFEISLKSPDIDPLLLLSGYAFPGLQQGAAVDLSASITSLGSWISARNIEGRFGGRIVNGKMTLDWRAKPRPKLAGNISLDSLSLETLAGLVMGEAAMQGGNAWSNSAFTSPLLLGLDGSVELNVKSVDMVSAGLGDGQPGQNLSGVLELSDGDIALRNARLQWLNGVLEGEISFARSQDNVLISSQFALTNAKLSTVVWKQDGKSVIDGQFGLAANIEGSGASIAEIVANLAGGGTISLANGAIQYLDPDAFGKILVLADRQKDEVLDEIGDNLVIEALAENSFKFKSGEAAFSIAGGKLRMSGVEISSSGTRLGGDIFVNLVDMMIEGDGRITFDPGKEAIPGISPEVEISIAGPVLQPDVRKDAKLLTSFLVTRARERKERAYEAQKEGILEAQRLSRMTLVSKYRAKAREKLARELESQARLEEEARLEEQKLLEELVAAEEKARKAREAIQARQREKEEKRRQDELLSKQRQLEAENELERQKADLKRRKEAFEMQVREQNAVRERRLQQKKLQTDQPTGLEKLAPPKNISPTGRPRKRQPTGSSESSGIFSNIGDRIGKFLEKSQ